MPFNKSGPLTQAELQLLWKSVVDQPGYASPLFTQPNSGIELVEQAQAQLAASSRAVDQTFQSLYILPWSGQTNDPASGAQFATVDLTLTRSGAGTIAAGLPLRIQPGLIFDHAPNDYSDDGPIQVLTGRRYLSAQTAIVPPGSLGPVTLPAVSEGTSPGYNVPLPGTINLLEQPGATFSNNGGSVVPLGSNNRLVLRDEPEVLTPDQIGQYILFTAGSNAGRSARMVAYTPSAPGNGGIAILSAEAVFAISGIVGTFQVGETVTLSSGSSAVFVWTDGLFVLLDWTAGAGLTGTITGTASGATATIVSTLQAPTLVAESGTAVWRVLDWVVDLGLQVQNLASPTGGRLPVLDEIGSEREIFRSNNETDDSYRERVATPADVVSPNAILRAMNRVLVPLGVHGCFREVGRELFRGFFYDGDPTSIDPNVAFAYDMDFVARPSDRYKLMLDYTEFRAFFLISVPPIGSGEFGFAYDDSATGFFDAAPYTDFYDGYPVGQAEIYRQLYNNVKMVIAGGVGFDLVLDGGPCS